MDGINGWKDTKWQNEILLKSKCTRTRVRRKKHAGEWCFLFLCFHFSSPWHNACSIKLCILKTNFQSDISNGIPTISHIELNNKHTFLPHFSLFIGWCDCGFTWLQELDLNSKLWGAENRNYQILCSKASMNCLNFNFWLNNSYCQMWFLSDIRQKLIWLNFGREKTV